MRSQGILSPFETMNTFEEIISEKELAHKDFNVKNVQVSVEGFIIVLTNINEEATEDDILDLVSEYGKVIHVHLNTDRRTGYTKGYCLIEYSTLNESVLAISKLDHKKYMDAELECDFAFSRPNSLLQERVLLKNK